jgi:hypothetical protein
LIDAAGVAADLRLDPHPEGGYFRETYRATATVVTERGLRAASTAIVFLVTAQRPSRFHRLASDELWFHQGGAPLELWMLEAGKSAGRVILGSVEAGGDARLMARVPAHVWQAARVAPAVPGATRAADAPSGPAWSLVSCVVTPGFDYDDFELADREQMLRERPGDAKLIAALT